MSMLLPLINDLHSEAMQDRHWKVLAAICHVKAIEPKYPSSASRTCSSSTSFFSEVH
jgi:hypothetical protein